MAPYALGRPSPDLPDGGRGSDPTSLFEFWLCNQLGNRVYAHRDAAGFASCGSRNAPTGERLMSQDNKNVVTQWNVARDRPGGSLPPGWNNMPGTRRKPEGGV